MGTRLQRDGLVPPFLWDLSEGIMMYQCQECYGHPENHQTGQLRCPVEYCTA